MKERPPAFQFYPRQFASDDQVSAMDLDVVGAHIILICSAAASPEGYRIHADHRAIRTRLRNPSDADWQRIKQQLLSGAWKVSEDGKWWIQDGLRRTFEKQREFSEKQSQIAAKRWINKKPDECQSDAKPLPKTCSSSSSSSSYKTYTKRPIQVGLHPNAGMSTCNECEVLFPEANLGKWMTKNPVRQFCSEKCLRAYEGKLVSA